LLYTYSEGDGLQPTFSEADKKNNYLRPTTGHRPLAVPLFEITKKKTSVSEKCHNLPHTSNMADATFQKQVITSYSLFLFFFPQWFVDMKTVKNDVL
jgi:hypothetical protein